MHCNALSEASEASGTLCDFRDLSVTSPRHFGTSSLVQQIAEVLAFFRRLGVHRPSTKKSGAAFRCRTPRPPDGFRVRRTFRRKDKGLSLGDTKILSWNLPLIAL